MLVFVSHSSIDTWVAKQIAKGIEEAGASTFSQNESTQCDNTG